ncbi:MAG: hypothetical protein VKO64_04990 [Candidatus Sericytochromatia bacterium]|nr:hypothetical protein [Candidatus Sericytochromatia bacterium]
MARFAWALVLLATACGQAPATQPVLRTNPAAAPAPAGRLPVTAQPPAPAAAGDAGDISKNPFVVWVKKAYPREAAQIITRYLADDGKGDRDRQTFRDQAVTQVAAEVLKNCAKGLPTGLTAKREGPAVICSGVVEQQGHRIAVRFEFVVYARSDGTIVIDQPASSIGAQVQGFDLLARLFGGDLRGKVREEIMKQLRVEGPRAAAAQPGLRWFPEGYFVLDPGFAFVNM